MTVAGNTADNLQFELSDQCLPGYMQTVITPFGLRFLEPLKTPFPAREIAEAVLCERLQIAVFDGRPLCELMATDMVESTPTEKDGKDPINVDSDPFYDQSYCGP
jgi:putative ATP-grasp target RiPP